MRISDWSSDVCSSDLFHLALAQRVDQPGREADAARLPLGEALANEMFGPPVHRVANFRAEAATTERDGIAGDRLPVETSPAGRVALPRDVELRAHGPGDTRAPSPDAQLPPQPTHDRRNSPR